MCFAHVFSDTEYFHMISELTGRALDIQGFKRTAGAAVVLAHQNGCVTQQWYEDIRGGIRSRLNNFDLSVESEAEADDKTFPATLWQL